MKQVLIRLLVDSRLRDRLERVVRERGVPAERLLEELLRERRGAGVRKGREGRPNGRRCSSFAAKPEP
jgi:hypothetical protein